MRRPSANRDQAIVLMLLDTGLRATELCSLTINDVDSKSGNVTIRHGMALSNVGIKVKMLIQVSFIKTVEKPD